MRIDVETNEEHGSGSGPTDAKSDSDEPWIAPDGCVWRWDGSLWIGLERDASGRWVETSEQVNPRDMDTLYPGNPRAVAEAPDLTAAREVVLAQLTRAVEMRLHQGDLVNLAASPELSRAAQAAAAAVLDQAVLLPPGWSLEWLKDAQERIPVAQAGPVAYPTAGRAAALIRYHLQNADIAQSDRGELAATADLLDTLQAAGATVPSYHDLHVTTDTIPRTSIFDLPYNIEVKCNRVAGWEVWDSSKGGAWRLLGGEYNAEPEENEEGRPVGGGLRLDVAGFVIVDSLGKTEGAGDG